MIQCQNCQQQIDTRSTWLTGDLPLSISSTRS